MELKNKTDQPEISAIVIAWNCRDDVQNLLESLKPAFKNISHEIVFIDNNSNDDTVEMIESDYPYVNLTANKQNNGVARARNQALKQARGRFIFIVDADCVYQKGDAKQAIKYLDSHPQVGLLGFRLYYPSGELQDSGRTLPTPRDLILNRMDGSDFIQSSIVFRRHRMRDFDPDKLREAGFVSGAAQFFKREILDEIGYLDESMFYGYEDSDFCARIIKSGKKVVYFPHVVLTHYHQRLSKKKPISKMTLSQIKSYQIFRRKHSRMMPTVNRQILTDNNPPEFTA